jgi:UDP-N-acetylmuramate--alanine ligase
MVDLDNIKSIYFLGIGGIGMSALARYFKEKGVSVYGYDRSATPLTRMLEAEGMNIQYVERLSHMPDDIDLMIWTPAVSTTNQLFGKATSLGLSILKRAEVLGLLSRKYKTIAVAGTHGKTTTSTLISFLLKKGNFDCSAFLGGISANFNSNYLSGDGEWLVLEADEYDRSFLKLRPDIGVITSMDPDHLDIYKETDAMYDAFIEFTALIRSDGFLLVHESVYEKEPGFKRSLLTYGSGPGADYRYSNLLVVEGQMQFDFEGEGFSYKKLRLPYPGRHNVENACAAIIVAHTLGINEDIIREALLEFKGIHRRYEIVCNGDNFVLIDDYAHHPKELEAAIEATRMMFPGKKLTGVFQPHLFSRTRDFADGFAEALDRLDECLLLDIYPAREEPIAGVNSQMIIDRMKLDSRVVSEKKDLTWRLLQLEPEVLLIMGAGDIDKIVPDLEKLFCESNKE